MYRAGPGFGIIWFSQTNAARYRVGGSATRRNQPRSCVEASMPTSNRRYDTWPTQGVSCTGTTTQCAISPAKPPWSPLTQAWWNDPTTAWTTMPKTAVEPATTGSLTEKRKIATTPSRIAR